MDLDGHLEAYRVGSGRLTRAVQFKDEQRKEELSTAYKTLDREVKKSAWKDKRHLCDALVSKAKPAAGRRDLTTTLSGKRSTQMKPMRDSARKLVTKKEKQRKQRADHFRKLELTTVACNLFRNTTSSPATGLSVNANPLTKASPECHKVAETWESSRTIWISDSST
ncbi:unnamed protein product [Heterobilharzia americana]|nr:unnamed protein product [Heterobilharzia americana]